MFLGFAQLRAFSKACGLCCNFFSEFPLSDSDVLATFSMFDLKICQLFFHWRSYNSHILRNHTHTLLNIESSSSWNQNPNRDLTGFSPLLNNKCIQIVKLELSWVHFIENRYREKNICKFSISYFLKIWKQTYLKYRTLP